MVIPGTQVRAVSYGRVAYADWLKGYGLIAIVDHGDGFLTLYAHCESLLKDVGVALANPSLQYLTAVGTTVYFNVDDGVGNQLWKYDGANLTEVRVGTYSSPDPYGLAAVGGKSVQRSTGVA